MNAASEAQRLRIADGLARDAATPGDSSDTQGAATLLGQTVAVSSYPGTAGVFYGIQILDLLGTESEGSAGVTYGRSGLTLYAFNLGRSVPPDGTNVLITFVPHRWVFRYD